MFPGKRNEGGYTWYRGVIKSKKDCPKQGRRLFILIGLKLRLDGDDKRRTDCRVQIHLGKTSWRDHQNKQCGTYEGQGGADNWAPTVAGIDRCYLPTLTILLPPECPA